VGEEAHWRGRRCRRSIEVPMVRLGQGEAQLQGGWRQRLRKERRSKPSWSISRLLTDGRNVSRSV